MQHDYTIGDLYFQLKELIEEEKIPLNTPVVYQRIEDHYFERNGWKTVKVKGDNYYNSVEFNEDLENVNLVKSGLGGDIGRTSQCFMENDFEPIDLNDEKILDQYVEAFCGFYYNEKEVFCITAHY